MEFTTNVVPLSSCNSETSIEYIGVENKECTTSTSAICLMTRVHICDREALKPGVKQNMVTISKDPLVYVSTNPIWAALIPETLMTASIATYPGRKIGEPNCDSTRIPTRKIIIPPIKSNLIASHLKKL
jgi:hypothetical protein